MRIPTIKGIIERRILVNYVADPIVVQKILPVPFQPKLYNNKAIVGICLIRLKHIRPKGFPAAIGISSENGAHRIAVQWQEHGKMKEGVFIPRRDTSSHVNAFVGGRIFPGCYFQATFDVKEQDDYYHVSFKSSDGTSISICGNKTEKLDTTSIFQSLDNASDFFKAGSVGFSPNGNKFDGLELRTFDWKVQPLHLTSIHSSFFEDETLFPKGSVHFDNALLMTSLEHEWHSVKQKVCC